MNWFVKHTTIDNYATHKHGNVRAWVERGKRVSRYFIPASSSSANLVERVFGKLTQPQTRRGVFTSVFQLEKRPCNYLHSYNENPRLLVWMKAVDEILGKVHPARQALAECS